MSAEGRSDKDPNSELSGSELEDDNINQERSNDRDLKSDIRNDEPSAFPKETEIERKSLAEESNENFQSDIENQKPKPKRMTFTQRTSD